MCRTRLSDRFITGRGIFEGDGRVFYRQRQQLNILYNIYSMLVCIKAVLIHSSYSQAVAPEPSPSEDLREVGSSSQLGDSVGTSDGGGFDTGAGTISGIMRASAASFFAAAGSSDTSGVGCSGQPEEEEEEEEVKKIN
jgi:hypothetical protein